MWPGWCPPIGESYSPMYSRMSYLYVSCDLVILTFSWPPRYANTTLLFISGWEEGKDGRGIIFINVFLYIYILYILYICIFSTESLLQISVYWHTVIAIVRSTLRKMLQLPCITGNPDTSTAPLPMWYTSMWYTSMIYTSTALYFYTEHTQVPSQFFKLTL
jgi:hypothetical protein